MYNTCSVRLYIYIYTFINPLSTLTQESNFKFIEEQDELQIILNNNTFKLR